MLKSRRHLPLAPLGAVCAVMGLAAGAPAWGQPAVEPFTVIGQAQKMDETRISASVYYDDLNLTTRAGRAKLDRRIRHTASELCARFGQYDYAAGLAFVCEDEAVLRAAPMKRQVIAKARLQVAEGPQGARGAPITVAVAPTH